MARSSEAPQEDLELVIERVFEAPPALVFKMWSDVEHLVRWHGPEGLALLHCEQDFREGGKWRRCMSSGPGHAHWISGEYREIRPHTRLSFTYINAYDGFETVVSMDFLDRPWRTHGDALPPVALHLEGRVRRSWLGLAQRLRAARGLCGAVRRRGGRAAGSAPERRGC